MAEREITLVNKEFKKKALGVNYGTLALDAVKSATVEGLTVGQMKENMDLVSYMDSVKSDSEILFSKKELGTILEKFRAMKWVAYFEELIEYDSYLESLIK